MGPSRPAVAEVTSSWQDTSEWGLRAWTVGVRAGPAGPWNEGRRRGPGRAQAAEELQPWESKSTHCVPDTQSTDTDLGLDPA